MWNLFYNDVDWWIIGNFDENQRIINDNKIGCFRNNKISFQFQKNLCFFEVIWKIGFVYRKLEKTIKKLNTTDFFLYYFAPIPQSENSRYLYPFPYWEKKVIVINLIYHKMNF